MFMKIVENVMVVEGVVDVLTPDIVNVSLVPSGVLSIEVTSNDGALQVS